MQTVNELNCNGLVCSKCSDTIEIIYNFNRTCLQNVKIYSSKKEILNYVEDATVKKEVLIQSEIFLCKENAMKHGNIESICQINIKEIENSLREEYFDEVDDDMLLEKKREYSKGKQGYLNIINSLIRL